MRANTSEVQKFLIFKTTSPQYIRVCSYFCSAKFEFIEFIHLQNCVSKALYLDLSDKIKNHQLVKLY